MTIPKFAVTARAVCAVSLVALLTACGGGGGKMSAPAVSVIPPPTSNTAEALPPTTVVRVSSIANTMPFGYRKPHVTGGALVRPWFPHRITYAHSNDQFIALGTFWEEGTFEITVWNHDGTLHSFIPFAHSNVTGKVKLDGNVLHVDWAEDNGYVGVRSFTLNDVFADKTIIHFTPAASVPGGWPANGPKAAIWAHTYANGDRLLVDNAHGGRMTRTDASGRKIWQHAGYTFTENVAILDPTEHPLRLVGREEIYTVNLATNAWEVAFTNDGSDARRVDERDNFPTACTHARKLTSGRYAGTQLVVYTGMYANQPAQVYLLEGNALRFVQTLPAASKGWQLDSNGTLWVSKDGQLLSRQWNGSSFAAPVSTAQPAPFGGVGEDGVQRLHYNPATDTMVLAGYRSGADRGIETGLVGTVLASYPRWSTGNRIPTWQLNPKALSGLFYDGSTKTLLPSTMAVTDQYVWLGSVFRDAATDSAPMVYGYRLRDGALVYEMHAAQFRDLRSGWLDLPCGLTARTLPNGDDVIVQEDNGFGQLLVWRVPKPG